MRYSAGLLMVLLCVAVTLAALLRADDDSQSGSKTSEAAAAKADDAKKSDEGKSEEEKKDDTSQSKSKDKQQDDKKKTDSAAADKSDKKSDKKSDDEKSKTVTVKQEPFKVVVSLDGVVESKRSTEVFLDPKTWTDWVVESAVQQGTRVKKGDTLIEFDTMKIDEDIRDEQANRKLAELSIEQSGAEIRLLEQSMPVDLQVAERASRLAESDLQQFVKEDRDLLQRQADFQVKVAGNDLEYQREELRQLEKMYKADDLTEETEEIILKRTRDQVEQYEFMNEITKIRRDRLVKIELPRREDQLKEGVNRTTVALQKAQTNLPISLDKLRLELEKQKFERTKAAERLTKLEYDRKLMKVTAPADGLVYYGPCEQGEWKQASQLASKLRKGGHVSADEVVMTIVDPDSLVVRATIPEKELWQVRRGMTGAVLPEGYGQERLPASIDALSAVPAPSGSFLATVLVDWARVPKELPPPAPGMDCTVKINVYSKDQALTLPGKAVQTDAQNDDRRYVWLQPSEGKPVRRNVTVGRKMDDKLEITEGLAVGDKVLREPPEEEK